MHRVEVPKTVVKDIKSVVGDVIRDYENYPDNLKFEKRYFNYAALGSGMVLDVSVAIRPVTSEEVKEGEELFSLFQKK
jgi:hypothetical protein